MKKQTKFEQVKSHLMTKGSITSWEAITLFKATRLSAIIHVLRHKQKLAIKTVDITEIDSNGNSCTFAKYVYTKTK